MDKVQLRQRLQSASYVLAAFGLGWLAAWTVYSPRDGLVRAPGVNTIHPSAASYVNQSLRLINERRYQEATQVCERGLAIHPRDPALLNNLAVANLELGDIGKGEEILERLVGEAPEFQRGRANSNWARSLRSQAEARIAEHRKLAESSSDLPAKISALKIVAQEYVRLNKHEDVIKTYEAILKLDPAHVLALNNAGVAHMALGQHQHALARFQEAAKEDPQGALYRNNIAWAQRAIQEQQK